MKNNKKIKLSRFGIFRRFLLSFIFISFFPLIIFYFNTTATFDEISEYVLEDFTVNIDYKTKQTTELQTTLIARQVEQFLNECENDLHAISEMEISERKYLEFSKIKRKKIWFQKRTDFHIEDIHENIPIYKEIAFIDEFGNEIVKISNNKIAKENELKNISIPENTRYKNETYFADTKKLKRNQIWVSHLAGFQVLKNEQIEQGKTLDNSFTGKYYDGVIRFCKPMLNEEDAFVGMVMIALDHRHLMEYTQHVLPNRKQQIVIPKYSSGDYAFMFDDEGWMLTHPKLWDIRGVDENGKFVKAYSSNSSKEDIKIGRIPFNLDSAMFIHENYPFVAKQVRLKNSGSVITTNVGGTEKVMAYAPIFYDKGVYQEYGIFGGITIGIQLGHFNQESKIIKGKMEGVFLDFRKNIIYYVLGIFSISLILSFFLSRNLSKPILQLSEFSKELASGNLNKKIKIERDDEIGELASSFNYMSEELLNINKQLENSLYDSQLARKSAEEYSIQLEYQLQLFKGIHQISNSLGTTFEIDKILKMILNHSVEIVNFDRAILYLLDEEKQNLLYKTSYGFSEEEENEISKVNFSIENDVCPEVWVVKQNRIVVKNFNELDKWSENCNSRKFPFVYIPLLSKGEILGVLGAEKTNTEIIISEDEIKALQILTNQAARLIEVTALYQEIINQRNFVESIFKLMPSAVITVNQNGIITSFNEAAKKIIAVPEDAIGHLASNYIPKYEEEKIGAIQEINKKGYYEQTDIEVVINNSKKFFSVFVTPLSGEGITTTDYLILIEDKTERKKLDEEIKEIEKLAFMGRFAAGIAHEIRNPLTGISLLLDDLHDTLRGNKTLAKLLEQALYEIERLEKLVHEILVYSAPSRGARTEENINDLVSSSLMLVKNQSKKKYLNIEFTPENDLPKLKVVKDKINQALINILLNAIEESEEHGSIKIATKLVKKEKQQSSFLVKKESVNLASVLIKICDSGKGIPTGLEKQIFEPFFTTKEKGTGLGLSITSSIITDHGGKIFVKNSKKGACFSIHLPLEKYE